MPRGRGGRRGRHLVVLHARSKNTGQSPSDEDAPTGSLPDDASADSEDRSTDVKKPNKSDVGEFRADGGEDEVGIDEEAVVHEGEDVDLKTGQAIPIHTRRLTEGDIDVDDDVESVSAEDGEPMEEADDDDVLSPAEKAARICRLPAKEAHADELVLFPFLDNASRALRDAYVCIRNFACMLWSEDPCIQVTVSRLSSYITSNMSAENVRLMIDAGLTAALPSTGGGSGGSTITQQHGYASSTTSSMSGELLAGNGTTGNSNSRAGKQGKETNRVITPPRQLAALSIPPTWSPWGTPQARANRDKLCYYAILFLERYGYINFGIFRILSPPLTHVSCTRGYQVDSCGNPGTEVAPLTPRRAAAERALAAAAAAAGTRRSGSVNGSLSSASANQYHPPALHIIVLGAGMAGLMVTRQLTYFGVKVTLLESRDRVGGRIWTGRKGEAHGELGAMVVTGLSANPVSVLARQIPLSLVSINTECSLYDPRGRLIPREIDEKIEEEFNRLLGTAAYLCHTKSMDSITLDSGFEKPLSLGEVIELLIRYQEKHRIQLKVTHRKLMVKLLERKNQLLEQMATERLQIEDAYERWQAASARANPCSVITPRVESLQQMAGKVLMPLAGRRDLNDAATREPSVVAGSDVKPDVEELNRQAFTSSTGSDAPSATEASPQLSPSVHTPLPIYNVGMQFEVRRLLSELHEAWKKFDPLQSALNRVNRQLEILLQCPPKEVYLTEAERRTLDWHLANLEFANATELHNLSLRYWDQDDVFELSGDHCVIKEGYGAVTDALATAIATGLSVGTGYFSGGGSSQSTQTSSTVIPTNGKQRDQLGSYHVGSGHIELKSSVKRIVYGENGVRVEALNAAFSQDDLIEHEADAVVCTLPLGVLKESVKQQSPLCSQQQQQPALTKRQHSQQSSSTSFANQAAALTRLTSPVFEPALPNWKIEAINRLGFGVLNKVILIFEKCFWDRTQNLFGHVSDCSDRRGELFLFWSITDHPVLIALVAGRAAMDLEQDAHQSANVSPQRNPLSSRGVPGSPAPKTITASSVSATSTTSTNMHALHEPIVARAMKILRGIFAQDASTPNAYTSGGLAAPLSDRRRAIPNPIDAIVTRWRSDPDSRGSYSYVSVGASGADYDLVSDPVSATENPIIGTVKSTAERGSPAKPSSFPSLVPPPSDTSTEKCIEQPAPASAVPRLFFAGEHTCRCFPATVHGALLSGLREAARIANTFFPGCTPVHEPDLKLNPMFAQ